MTRAIRVNGGGLADRSGTRLTSDAVATHVRFDTHPAQAVIRQVSTRLLLDTLASS
jgi:hypothetical protein